MTLADKHSAVEVVRIIEIVGMLVLEDWFQTALSKQPTLAVRGFFG